MLLPVHNSINWSLRGNWDDGKKHAFWKTVQGILHMLRSWYVPVLGYPYYDDVIKWKHFPRYWPFVRGIHRSRWVPLTKPVTPNFDIYIDLRLNKRLSKQSRGWWFETQSRPLWRHCNVLWWLGLVSPRKGPNALSFSELCAMQTFHSIE